jgi:uncharacterized membrane protein
MIWILFFLTPIILTILYIVQFYKKFGKDVPVKKSSRLLIKPPSDISPSVLGALLNENGKPKEENFLAEILYLAYKKHIEIMEKYINGKKQVVLLKLNKKNLDASEKIVFGYIFKKKDSVILSDTLRSSDRFRDCIKNWQAIANKEARAYQHKHGWFHESKIRKMVDKIKRDYVFGLVLLLFIGFFIFGVALDHYPYWVGPILGFGAGYAISVILVYLSSNFLYKRSNFGSKEYQKWMDFKSSLEKYFYLHKKPPSSVAIWDKMIIYAVSLGVAKKAIYDMEKVSFLKRDVSSLLKFKIRFG